MHTHAPIHTLSYTHTHAHTQRHTYRQTTSCIDTHTLTHTHTHRHTQTHVETEKSRIHTFTHAHTHTHRSPAVHQPGCAAGHRQAVLSLGSGPWLRPGGCSEGPVCHTLWIQAALCHTQITSLSPSLTLSLTLSLALSLPQARRSHRRVEARRSILARPTEMKKLPSELNKGRPAGRIPPPHTHTHICIALLPCNNTVCHSVIKGPGSEGEGTRPLSMCRPSH